MFRKLPHDVFYIIVQFANPAIVDIKAFRGVFKGLDKMIDKILVPYYNYNICVNEFRYNDTPNNFCMSITKRTRSKMCVGRYEDWYRPDVMVEYINPCYRYYRMNYHLKRATYANGNRVHMHWDTLGRSNGMIF